MNNVIWSLVLILLMSINTLAQTHTEEIKEFQAELNKEFNDPEKSPLTLKDRETFKELDFFEIDEKYKVEATFVRTSDTKPFKMKTSTNRRPLYQKYGDIYFRVEGKKFKLSLYQNLKSIEKEEYKDYLFLPFTDATNGTETYGGGRFIDLKIPSGNTIVVDFNKAYNPLCSYNHKYSCPAPPAENDLGMKILAGVKKYDK